MVVLFINLGRANLTLNSKDSGSTWQFGYSKGFKNSSMDKKQLEELKKSLIVKKIVKGYNEKLYDYGEKKNIKLVKENL